jgi:DNA anti-recombination protein RmuC
MEDEWTNKRMNDFSGRVDRFEGDVKERFDKVDRRFDKVDQRFERLEHKLDVRFEKVEADAKERSAKSDAVIVALGEKIDGMSRWLMRGLVTIVGAVIIKAFVG